MSHILETTWYNLAIQDPVSLIWITPSLFFAEGSLLASQEGNQTVHSNEEAALLLGVMRNQLLIHGLEGYQMKEDQLKIDTFKDWIKVNS